MFKYVLHPGHLKWRCYFTLNNILCNNNEVQGNRKMGMYGKSMKNAYVRKGKLASASR